MRVLVVEDEEVMAEAVTTVLSRAGHRVDVVHDGRSALERTALTTFDVVVLDRDLPMLHGDDVCRAIVADGQARILMLTASRSLEDRVEGLDIGADDYLAKPFAVAELRARVSALGRRTAPAQPPTFKVGDLFIDGPRRRARRAGRDLQLSLKELGVLEVLAADPGRVVSAEELLDRVWDESTDPFTTVVRVTIMGLRRKLGRPGIETVRGAGYRLVTA